MKYNFPKGFWWGTATSSHQIEGRQKNDWTEWEKANSQRLASEAEKVFAAKSPVWDEIKAEAQNPDNYISGIADDSWNRWPDDLKLLKELGVNAYRFSIEWSRVEPEFGAIDENAIAHYKQVIQDLQDNNIEPFVTVLHRSTPLWFEKKGGWSHKESVCNFEYYTKLLTERFQGVKYWMPMNEPFLNVTAGYVAGLIPPDRKNIIAALRAYNNMIKGFNAASRVIKARIPEARVGTAHAAVIAYPEKNKWYNKILCDLVHYFANWKFLDGVCKYTDFVGIQYYTRGVIGWRRKFGFLPLPQEIYIQGSHSDLGQEIYPQGLFAYGQLLWKRYGKEIIVTENGVADRNDNLRPGVIDSHLAEIEKLTRSGVRMGGYFHWSLLDNFEWDKGFWPRFGLVAVDRNTLERRPRKSFDGYKKTIKENI